MVKLRKLHEIDWIVHLILLHSIQPMMYYSRRSLEYLNVPLLQDYSNSVLSYCLHSFLPSHNVNYVCLTPTINPIMNLGQSSDSIR